MTGVGSSLFDLFVKIGNATGHDAAVLESVPGVVSPLTVVFGQMLEAPFEVVAKPTVGCGLEVVPNGNSKSRRLTNAEILSGANIVDRFVGIVIEIEGSLHDLSYAFLVLLKRSSLDVFGFDDRSFSAFKVVLPSCHCIVPFLVNFELC